MWKAEDFLLKRKRKLAKAKIDIFFKKEYSREKRGDLAVF